MIPALVVIVIASCSGGGSGDCGGGCATLCCSGCVAWRSWLHGLMVAVAVVAVVSHRVAVAAWHGMVVAVTWLDGGCGRRWWWQSCHVMGAAWHGGSGQSHGLVVAAVAWRRSQRLHRGGMCGGGVHGDMVHVVTRVGQGGACSKKGPQQGGECSGREAQQEARAVGKGRGGHNRHRGRGERE